MDGPDLKPLAPLSPRTHPLRSAALPVSARAASARASDTG